MIKNHIVITAFVTLTLVVYIFCWVNRKNGEEFLCAVRYCMEYSDLEKIPDIHCTVIDDKEKYLLVEIRNTTWWQSANYSLVHLKFANYDNEKPNDRILIEKGEVIRGSRYRDVKEAFITEINQIFNVVPNEMECEHVVRTSIDNN